MTNFKNSLCLLVVLLTTVFACNDATDLGVDLISGDFTDIKFTDTLSIEALTVKQDSIFTYTNQVTAQAGTYLIGNISESVMGSAKASTYINFLLNTTSQAGGADFEGATFDSLVLSLAYDSTRVYGDTLLAQSFVVERLCEPMDNELEYIYSDQSYGVCLGRIGEKLNFNPEPKTKVVSIVDEDTITYVPHLRIQLDPRLGQELMDLDSATYSTSEFFQEVFNGIKISSSVPHANILGFNLKSSQSYMRLYYTKDGEPEVFTYIIGGLSVKYSEYNHDYTNAVVNDFIDNQTLSDSLVFVQGMSGTNVKIDFPTIGQLGDVVVNKADLEFTTAFIPGDDTINFSAPVRLVLTYLSDDGNYYFIEDVNYAINAGDLNTFGGGIEWDDENGTFIQRYRFNISNYIQDIIDCADENGEIDHCLPNSAINNALYIQPYLKNQFSNRTVLYGAKHSQYPTKLYLTYTQQ